MKIFVLVFVAAILSVCDRPPTSEADHSKHDHTQTNHGVRDHSKKESSPGAAEAPHALQFIDTMTAHHQSAVEMALLANTRTQRDEMKKLTQWIISGQRREIKDMQEWRAKWFGEAKAALNMDFPGMKMGRVAMDTVKLASLKGNEFDVEFLNQMIPHQEGAIEMARALRTEDNYVELRNLADSTITSQSAVVEQMKGWLGSWSVAEK